MFPLSHLKSRTRRKKTMQECKTYNSSQILENCRIVFDFMSTISHCCALQSRLESQIASELVRYLGLPSHHDEQKNWDTLKALSYILRNDDLETPVLDAGSSANSAILKWLSLLGYTKLYACDIREKASRYDKGQIEFSVQDITSTDYPDKFFQAVTSISVIEHGAPLDRFVKEMHRILKPGGFLLVSTDYWSEFIDCSGIFPYGKENAEMKVFQPNELEEFCRMAESCGLSLCSPLNLKTKERAVRWDRVDREYTFAFIAFTKKKLG